MPRLSGTQLSWLPAPLPAGITTVIGNVKRGLLPALLQEDVGRGSLREGTETPTKVPIFSRKVMETYSIPSPKLVAEDESQYFPIPVAQDPGLVTVWGIS